MVSTSIKNPISVLFLGNSHTYYHFMPQMLEGLCREGLTGGRIVTHQSTGQGAGLAWHWKNPLTTRLLEQRCWDYVVLQERSGGCLEDPDSFHHHIALLDRVVRAAGARTVLYMTWARRKRPQTLNTIAAAYETAAQALGTLLVPVGRAFEVARLRLPQLDLHHTDGRHAGPTGAYLAACTFLAALLEISPVGLPGRLTVGGKVRVDLPENHARQIQAIAWKIMRTV